MNSISSRARAARSGSLNDSASSISARRSSTPAAVLALRLRVSSAPASPSPPGAPRRRRRRPRCARPARRCSLGGADDARPRGTRRRVVEQQREVAQALGVADVARRGPSYSTRHTSPSRRSAARPRVAAVASTRRRAGARRRRAPRRQRLDASELSPITGTPSASERSRARLDHRPRGVASPGPSRRASTRLVEVEQRQRRRRATAARPPRARPPCGRARRPSRRARRRSRREVARHRARRRSPPRRRVARRRTARAASRPPPRARRGGAPRRAGGDAIETIQTLSRGKSAKPRAARYSSSRRASARDVVDRHGSAQRHAGIAGRRWANSSTAFSSSPRRPCSTAARRAARGEIGTVESAGATRAYASSMSRSASGAALLAARRARCSGMTTAPRVAHVGRDAVDSRSPFPRGQVSSSSGRSMCVPAPRTAASWSPSCADARTARAPRRLALERVGPEVGCGPVEHERERRRVAEPARDRDRLVDERLAAVGSLAPVDRDREPDEQAGARRALSAGSAAAAPPRAR